MQIDKNQILDLLRNQGDSGKAEQADRELPSQVDTDNPEHQNLLSRFGVDLNEIAGNFLKGKIPGL